MSRTLMLMASGAAAVAGRPGLVVLHSVGKFLALAALRDKGWQQAAQARLAHAGARMRGLLASYGIHARGTPLFHWCPQAEPEAFHEHMARHAILVRLFRDAGRGIRLGLPAHDAQWERLDHALRPWNQ